MRGSILAALVAAAILMSGCETIRTLPPEIVKVPVPVPCSVEFPVKPSIRSTEDLLKLDRYRRTLAIWIDRQALLDYSALLEATLNGCRP